MDFIIVTSYIDSTTSCETNSEAQTFLDSLEFNGTTPLLQIFHRLSDDSFKLIGQSSSKNFTTYTFCGKAPYVESYSDYEYYDW